jgi:hypothetical protein
MLLANQYFEDCWADRQCEEILLRSWIVAIY